MGAEVCVRLPLPLHAVPVLLALYERRRVSVAIDTEVLEVDVVLREIEVRLVLAAVYGRSVVWIRALVLVGDAVHEQPVCNVKFLVTLDLLSTKGADVMTTDALVVLVGVLAGEC